MRLVRIVNSISIVNNVIVMDEDIHLVPKLG